MKQTAHNTFDQIYDTYWKELYMVAYRRLRSREDVEDLLQEIFLSIAERPHILERQGSIRGYLHQSLKNKIIDFYRREAVKGSFDQEWGWLFTEAAADGCDSLLVQKEIASLIDQEVGAMPDRMQAVHWLSREHHLSNAEIAEQLDISVQTVKNQLGVASRRLRTVLEDYRLYLLLCIPLTF